MNNFIGALSDNLIFIMVVIVLLAILGGILAYFMAFSFWWVGIPFGVAVFVLLIARLMDRLTGLGM